MALSAAFLSMDWCKLIAHIAARDYRVNSKWIRVRQTVLCMSFVLCTVANDFAHAKNISGASLAIISSQRIAVVSEV